MEDRYLFRGKRVHGEGWVIGYFANLIEDAIIVEKTPWSFDKVVDIKPETICQCTGIRDKNGKLIFENDILSGHIDDEYPEDETRKLVMWHENGWCSMEDGCADYEELDDFDSGNFEVCGNVFDNPELLKFGNKEVTDNENAEVRR